MFDELVDLDNYLDTLMLDMTMSIAKVKKGGDLVAIVECPHDEHKVKKPQNFDREPHTCGP